MGDLTDQVIDQTEGPTTCVQIQTKLSTHLTLFQQYHFISRPCLASNIKRIPKHHAHHSSLELLPSCSQTSYPVFFYLRFVAIKYSATLHCPARAGVSFECVQVGSSRAFTNLPAAGRLSGTISLTAKASHRRVTRQSTNPIHLGGRQVLPSVTRPRNVFHVGRILHFDLQTRLGEFRLYTLRHPFQTPP